MKPTGLQKTTVELPFDVKLDTGTSSEIRPQQLFDVMQNVDLHRAGVVSRRTGASNLSAFDLNATAINNVMRLAARGDEPLIIEEDKRAFDDDGSLDGNAGELVAAWSEEEQRWSTHARVPCASLKRLLYRREGQFESSSCAVSDDGSTLLVAYGQSGGVTNAIISQVWDITKETPVLIQDTLVHEEGLAFSGDVKCCSMGDHLYLVWYGSSLQVQAYSLLTNDWAVAIDVTTPALTVVSEFDVTENGSDVFIGEVHGSSPDNVGIYKVNAAGTTSTLLATLTTTAATTALTVGLGCSVAGTLNVVTSEGANVKFYDVNTVTGAGATTPIAVNATPAVVRFARVGVVTTGLQAWVFFWEEGDNNPSHVACCLRWRKMSAAAGWAAVGVEKFLPFTLMTAHPFWYDDRGGDEALAPWGRVFVPICCADTSPNVDNNDMYTRVAYSLFEISTDDPTDVNDRGIFVANWAPDLCFHYVTPSLSGGMALRGCLAGAKYYNLDRVVGEISRGTDSLGSHGDFILHAADMVEIDLASHRVDAHVERRERQLLSTEQRGYTQFSGALPWVYDGVGAHEGGWPWRPRVLEAVRSAGGGLTDGATYFYRVVYEGLDASGRYWRSAPSYATEFDEGDNSATTNTANRTIVVKFRPIPFSSMHREFRQVTAKLYTTHPSTGNERFFLISEEVFDPSNTAYITFSHSVEVDLGEDVIYVSDGELDNYCPPPAALIEGHRNRLFAFSDYDQKIWYTKPELYGRGFEWVLEQSIVFPPARCNGIASLEGTLVVFAPTSIYAMEGEGPSVTGNPPNAFTTWVQLSSEIGCAQRGAVVSTPMGIVFKSQLGWWLLNRTMQLSFIGDAVSSYAQNNVLSMTLDRERAQVKILTLDEEGNRPVLNYWYTEDRWSVDTRPDGFIDTIDMKSIGGEVYFASDSLVQRTDETTYLDGSNVASADGWYQMRIETGWIRFDNLAAVKRLWRFMLPLEKVDESGLTVMVYINWDPADVILNETWPALDDDGNPSGELGVRSLRFHMPRQKIKSVKFVIFDSPVIEEDDGVFFYDGTGGFRLFGLGFELGVKRGTTKGEGQGMPSTAGVVP